MFSKEIFIFVAKMHFINTNNDQTQIILLKDDDQLLNRSVSRISYIFTKNMNYCILLRIEFIQTQLEKCKYFSLKSIQIN